MKLAVEWGLEHRNLDGIRSIGADELSWKKGHKYLTLVYQFDHSCRRLLHIARDRKATSFNTFFDMLGDDRTRDIRFVASDMWEGFPQGGPRPMRRRLARPRPFPRHVAHEQGHRPRPARRGARPPRERKQPYLTKTMWLLLKRPKNLRRGERARLRDLVAINLKTVRAYLLKEDFQRFWRYRSVAAATAFLQDWTRRALCSRIEPLKKSLAPFATINGSSRTGSFPADSPPPAQPRVSTERHESRCERRTGFEPTNTPSSPCITPSANYPSHLGSPTDSPDEALTGHLITAAGDAWGATSPVSVGARAAAAT
ncbi:MAG: transposase [Myxococcales bacterium]|nr:transposase [Myxococcales bacterium]